MCFLIMEGFMPLSATLDKTEVFLVLQKNPCFMTSQAPLCSALMLSYDPPAAFELAIKHNEQQVDI